eukprot:3381453-Pyramimonas_sp.AAC.1
MMRRRRRSKGEGRAGAGDEEQEEQEEHKGGSVVTVCMKIEAQMIASSALIVLLSFSRRLVGIL